MSKIIFTIIANLFAALACIIFWLIGLALLFPLNKDMPTSQYLVYFYSLTFFSLFPYHSAQFIAGVKLAKYPRIITPLVYLLFMAGFIAFVANRSAPFALYLIPVIASYAGAARGEK